MKTLKQLKAENQSLFDAFPPPHIETDKEFKKACKTVAYNNLAISALEVQGVHQLRLETDLKGLKEKLDRIEGNYDHWKVNTTSIEQGKDPKATYSRLLGIKDIKEQIRFIEYLLDT